MHSLLVIWLIHFQSVELEYKMFILLEAYQLDQSVVTVAKAITTSSSGGHFFTHTYRWAHITLVVSYHSLSRTGTNSQMPNKPSTRAEKEIAIFTTKTHFHSKTTRQEPSFSCYNLSPCSHFPTAKSLNNQHHCPIFYRTKAPVVLTIQHF